MIEMFKIIGAVLFSLGGGGAIVFALSSWLGKVWASRILEKEKKEYTLEIESFKSQLTSGLNTLNSINEKSLYISKAQYDKEFDIYQEIWEKMFDCIVATVNLYPTLQDVPTDEDKKKEWINIKFDNFTEKYNSYLRTIDRYAPFYKEEFYNKFTSVRDTCSRMGKIFKRYNYDLKYNLSYSLVRDATMTSIELEDINNIPKKLEEKRYELQIEIHKYLENLQTFK